MGGKFDWIKLRIGVREKELFRATAEKEGVSISEWLRRLGLLRAAELGLIDRPAKRGQ